MILKTLYSSGVNIMEYFRTKNNVQENEKDAILAAYDLQAGSYIKHLPIKSMYHIDGHPKEMTSHQYLCEFVKYLGDEISQFEHSSILEAGVGEATTLAYLIEYMEESSSKFFGFDIAPSRILYGKEFLRQKKQEAELFVGNMLSIPYQDNSFDIVYTVHAIEPNTSDAKNIIKELYRVTKKYLILIEPSFELGNNETKANINKHAYVKELKQQVDELKYEVVKYKLFPVGTFSNQPAIMIIKKDSNCDDVTSYCCPSCHSKIVFDNGGGYCINCSVFYPIIKKIPILTREAGVFFSHYLDEF